MEAIEQHRVERCRTIKEIDETMCDMAVNNNHF
jgi:hypothetical protein